MASKVAKSKGKVVVAMSGGVDSCVAAALLQLQGYDVIGMSIQTFDSGKDEKVVAVVDSAKDKLDSSNYDKKQKTAQISNAYINDLKTLM